MTLELAYNAKCARIVHQLTGPKQRLQLRQVPSDWVLSSEGKGPDLATTIARLRRLAQRKGYVVDEGYTVEDRRPITEKLTP